MIDKEKNQFEQLERHFIDENLRKMILYSAKNLSEDKIVERQKFLNDKIGQRKNLYIYPEKVNV